MNLQVIIPAGQTEMTVNGLHQWDYGRKLDIHAPDLPAIVEVHFACPGMDEAVVRVGSAASGAVTVAIPDRCLEQSSPITAWVYEVGEISGQTIKTLTLNITARKRPQTTEAIDPETSNKYTEAVAAMNEATAAMQNGDIKAKEADHATEADKASKIKTIVIRSYDDLMSYIPLIPNANYISYAVAINDYPITFPDGTVLPAWGTGMLVVEADASLTLTYPDGSIISAFCVNTDPCTWSVKKLSGVSSVGSDNKVTAPGLYAVTLHYSGESHTHMLSIVDLNKRVQSVPDSDGYYAVYVPGSNVIAPSMEGIASVEKVVCIAKYDF